MTAKGLISRDVVRRLALTARGSKLSRRPSATQKRACSLLDSGSANC